MEHQKQDNLDCHAAARFLVPDNPENLPRRGSRRHRQSVSITVLIVDGHEGIIGVLQVSLPTFPVEF